MLELTIPIPETPHTECAVLGAILRNEGLFDLATALAVTADSFRDGFRSAVFQAMTELAKAGEKIDLMPLGNRFPDHKSELAGLLDEVATTVHFEDWCRLLKRYEAARTVRMAGIALLGTLGKEPNADPSELISSTEGALDEAQKAIQGRHVATIREMATEYIENSVNAHRAAMPYFPPGTEGYAALHHRKRELFVVAADTGSGKTALATGTVCQCLKAGLNVVYFCTESTGGDILARIAAQFCGIPHFITINRNPDQAQLQKFGHCLRDMSQYDRQLFVRGCETGIRTPEDMRAELRTLVNRVGRIDMVVVDFLQFMDVPKFLKAKTKKEQVDYCISRIHAMLIEFDAAGMVLVQINRDGQKSGGMPNLAHIKDTSEIAQLAHTVGFLHRMKKDNRDVTWFYSRKTRNQPPFCLELEWNGVGYDSRMKYAADVR